MTAIYELRLKSPAGVEFARLAANPGGQDITKTGFEELAMTDFVNSYGLCSFILPGNHEILPQLVERAQVEVWHSDPENGIVNAKEWSGLFLDEKREFKNGRHLFQAYCFSDNFKLQDRYNMWKADTVNRSAFAGVAAETFCKTLVSYNMTSLATIANGRYVEGAMTGVTVAADSGGGNSVTHKCAWDNVLKVLQKVASTGGGDFNLVKTGAEAWEFRWYPGQLGTDRSATLTFSTDFGNMGDPVYTKIRSTKKTSVVVGGQDTGADRKLGKATGNNYSASANYEEFFNASGQPQTTTGLDNIGAQRVKVVRDQEELSFSMLQTPTCLYRKHYFLGDIITVKYLDVAVYMPKIIGVTTSLLRSGQVIISPEVSYVG